jgi:hypothetical protein
MPLQHLFCLAALAVLIALPARGQADPKFDKDEVIAEWRALSAKITTARLKSVREFAGSRNGTPNELSTKTIAIRAFSPTGFKDTWTREACDANGAVKETLNSFGIANQRYTANLRRPKGKEGWLLADLKLHDKGDPIAPLMRFRIACPWHVR